MDEAKSGLDSLLDVYRNIVFFDVETTGFNAQANRIIELAAIGVRRNFQGKAEIWREMDVYCKLPEGQKIPEEIIKLTGITDQMLIEHGVYYECHVKAMLSYMGWFTHSDTYNCYLKWIKPRIHVGRLKKIASKLDRRRNRNEAMERRALCAAA